MQSEPTTAAGTKGDDDEEALLQHGARFERLLEELEATAGPHTWPRVEELVQLLVELYGAGLERLLRHVEGAGALGRDLEDRVCADELLSSLLLLHGLHPVPTEARVRRAVEAAGAELGLGAAIEVVGVGEDGVARLRLPPGGCASSRANVEELLRGVVEEAAPEVARVEVEADLPGARDDGPLVQIEARRGRRQEGSRRRTSP